MSKRNEEPTPRREPTIRYHRTLCLEAFDGGVKLSHLQELLRQASDRGFVPNANVRIRSIASHTSPYETIDISDVA